MLQRFWHRIDYYLEQKRFIIALIFINLLGSIYGFFLYKEQLLATPTKLLIFVPDSSLASIFFTIFLILYLFKKRYPLIEVLAAVSLFKYGVWATGVILWGAWVTEPSVMKMITLETVSWTNMILIFTHIAMVLQALLFYKKYSFGFWYILFAGIWLFSNDLLDYNLDIHPWLPDSINSLDYIVGKYTLYLSGFTLLLFYFLSILRRKDE